VDKLVSQFDVALTLVGLLHFSYPPDQRLG